MILSISIHRLSIFFSALILSNALSAQKVDTVVDMGIYKSYFSNALRQPLYVTYKLYKGGGGCSRDEEGFSFKKCGVNTANDDDYTGSHLDKGHLANAEDFAYDCDKEEKTFCYFNCVPQTIKLNRGIWKTYEEEIRVLSQKRTLFVIAGAIYGKKTLGNDKLAVPTHCYKIVLSPKSKTVLYCLLFPNDDSKKVTRLTVAALKKKLGYGLVP